MIKDMTSKIPWYIEFLLIFKPIYYSTDYAANGDQHATLGVKYLFGKTYVVSEIHADDPDLTQVESLDISE